MEVQSLSKKERDYKERYVTIIVVYIDKCTEMRFVNEGY